MIKISDYYLDLESIFKLEKDQRELLVGYYDRLLDYSGMGDNSRVSSLFNTLIKTGYFKNRVEEDRNDKVTLIMEKNEV
jgi:hypothetical protein